MLPRNGSPSSPWYGWYSRIAAGLLPSFTYRLLLGDSKVRVTAATRDAEGAEYQWPDKQRVGVVGECIGTSYPAGRSPSHLSDD